ncbi:MAG: response regulator [Acidimicrobiia bacterium]
MSGRPILTEPIRVAIVDDHKVVRLGLQAFLSIHDDIEVVGEASNGEEAVQLVADTNPDVVLMDLQMPVMDGPEAIAVIRAEYDQTHVVALTTFDDPNLAQRALAAGATGFLYKDADEQELMSAIRMAHRGRSVVAPEAMQLLVQGEEEGYVVHLTEREDEVLALVAVGKTNPEVAERLSVSVSTVNFHVHNILDKLGAKTRTEAVTIAAREGLIDI